MFSKWKKKKSFSALIMAEQILSASEVLSGQPPLLFTSSVILLSRSPKGVKCPSSNLPLILTHTQRGTQIVYNDKIVLIYPACSINHIISNNCHRQLGSQLWDFILIDFLTCSQPWMIWFPSDTMFIKGILHKGINRYCWLDLYELWGKAEHCPLF